MVLGITPNTKFVYSLRLLSEEISLHIFHYFI